MNALRTIAAIALAAFMVFGPIAASGATSSMTLTTNAASYTGSQAITISGTITPGPTVASNVVITTKGPNGAVDIGSAPVAQSTGTFAYTLVAGGGSNWVSGTYTVNATWGAQGNTATQTTTFSYQAVGVSGSTTTVTTTTTTTVTTTVALSATTTTTTVTSSVVNPDTTQLTTIASDVSGMQSTLSTLSTAINGMTSTLNTISTGVTGITNTLSSLSTNLTTLNGIGSQISSMNSSVNNDTTYVLVVAALAAITLVLELAILVRKLS